MPVSVWHPCNLSSLKTLDKGMAGVINNQSYVRYLPEIIHNIAALLMFLFIVCSHILSEINGMVASRGF
jgi:hypothetical protein